MRASKFKGKTPRATRPLSPAAGVSAPPGASFPVSALLSLVLLIAVFGAFAPILSNAFVNYDDPDYVTTNAHVQHGLNWASLAWAFRSSEHGNWHPLTWLTHTLECQVFGLKPWGHHLTSLLLHALNTCLVFVLFKRMTGAMWRSFMVAALFGLHPLRVESVAWVAEQKDVLSAAFGLLALWAYTRYAQRVHGPQSAVHRPQPRNLSSESADHQSREKGRSEARRGAKFQISDFRFQIRNSGWFYYLLALLLYAFSLMSKPMLVTMPFILLLLDYWPLGRFQESIPAVPPASNPNPQPPATHHWRALGRLALEKGPFLLLALTSSVVTFLVQNKVGAVATLAGATPIARLANALVAYCRYLGKLVWPSHLAVFYPLPTFLAIEVLVAAALLLLGVSALVVALRRKRPYLPMGWFWFLGTLVPVIGLVQVGSQSMADRYSYLPSIGVLVVVVWSVHALISSWRYHRIAALLLAAVPLLAFGWLTRQQAGYWRDSGTLFEHALAVTGPNTTVYWHLGDYAFIDRANLPEAVDYYRKALELDPSFPDAHFQLANALYRQGAREEAVREYEEALRCRPGWARVHSNFGYVLESMGRLDDALAQLREAVKLEPASAEAQSNLGRVLYRKGALAESIDHLQRAMALNPAVPDIHNTLGLALEATGRQDDALREFEVAVRLKPDFAYAHLCIAQALLKQGRREDALPHLKEAVRLDPSLEPARRQLQSLER